jgi:hypothetical protein
MPTNVRVMLYCVLGGGSLAIGALGAGHWIAWWFAGIVLALAFVPVALFGPRGFLRQFGAVAVALLIITVLCTWSEALIFLPTSELLPDPVQALIGSCVTYVGVAAVLALLAQMLQLNRPSVAEPAHRRVLGAVVAVLLSGIAYLLYYTVFGAITYQFFTKGYYPDAPTAVANLGWWFWAIQFARGVLMTLATIPIIYTLRMRRWQTAVVAGLIVWVAGGLAPLLIPNPVMGLSQRLIHIVEIFTQNFSLGVTAALLLRV